MQPKLSLLAVVLSAVSIVSAQNDATSTISPEGLSSLLNLIQTAADDPAFTSAIAAATTVPVESLLAQGSEYVSSIFTATTSVPLPSYIAGLPSSAQAPVSSYYAKIGSAVRAAEGLTTATGSKSSSPGSLSAASATASASAKASNGAVAQHPGAFIAAAAGAVGFAAML